MFLFGQISSAPKETDSYNSSFVFDYLLSLCGNFLDFFFSFVKSYISQKKCKKFMLKNVRKGRGQGR